MLTPLVSICAVFDHCVAFVVVLDAATFEVLLMPPLLPPQSVSLCCTPGGDKQKMTPLLSSSMCFRRMMNPQHQREAWHCINCGKVTVRKRHWGNSTSPPVMLDKGGRSGVMRRADNRNGRAVAQAMLVEILHFEQQDQHSAGAAHPIRKSRVSRNSLSRILLGDITISSWIGPQRAIGLGKWSRLKSHSN
jgi:hypothetical protein